MKYLDCDVFDLMVFDMSGKLITELNALSDSRIFITGDGDEAFVNVSNVFFDEELIKFLGKENKQNISDYDKALGKEKTSVTFGKNNIRKCKLIAKGILIDQEENMVRKYTIEVPNAETVNEISFGGKTHDVHEFNLRLKVNTYNDGDYFIIHFEDVK